MDERSLLAMSHYVEPNPVRAKLVADAEDYAWRSARAFVTGQLFDVVCKHKRTGRPLAGEDFEQTLSQLVGRDLRLKKPGRIRIKK